MKESLLRRLAKDVLGEENSRKIWQRIEIIGDIAIIRKPFDYSLEKLKILAEKVIQELPYVKSVWCAVSEVKGDFRLRDYKHLAGEQRSLTLYKEHGCLFKVDITKTYISPALNYEHLRIAKLVRSNEFVVNMFAGVGLFSIIIAKYSKPSKVISIDINPVAYELMKENIKLNKVEGIVVPELGDAAEVSKKYFGRADRVLMPLPQLAYPYFGVAVNLIKSKGFIHIYEFEKAKSRSEAINRVSEKYQDKVRKLNLKANIVYGRVIRSVGPRKYQVVLDIEIYK